MVVPVLNEMAELPDRVAYFRALESQVCELVFVDGGSDDGTRDYLLSENFHCIEAPAGRAMQMNAGAAETKAECIVFHHVDTLLPVGAIDLLSKSDFQWGAFNVALDHKGLIYSWISAGINFRTRVSGVATGDQCLFVRRSIFEQLNGFAPIVLMEDVEFCRRARKLSKLWLMPLSVVTSARRWQKHGPIRTIILMWYLQLIFRLGASPEAIHRRYYPNRQKHLRK